MLRYQVVGSDIDTLQKKYRTRWTFFRVKLVFECEFEMSWSLGPWDPWTLEPLDLGNLGPLPSSNTSSYFPLHPPISSSYSPPLVQYGLVMGGGGGELWHLRMRLEMYLWPLYWSSGTSSFLLHYLPVTSSHLLLIPPSYSTLLPNLLPIPPTSSLRMSDD